MTERAWSTASYGRFLIVIAGLGGLLYGIDIGIIAAALLYLSKTVNLTVEQTSVIVAAVLGGGMCSSLVAGLLADWFGRKRMMTVSGMMFVASVGLIVISQGFAPLLIGRLLQGASGGVIAVVVPLYLAECLGAKNRGKGTAVFQFMLTFGIVIAALIGWFYTSRAEAAIAAAANNAVLVKTVQDQAWRGMFLAVIYPGLIFTAGSFFLSETPRWLFRRGRKQEALASLLRTSPEDEAGLQLREMEDLAAEKSGDAGTHSSGPLLQRKYVIPFVLACIVLVCNQTRTGINSILSFRRHHSEAGGHECATCDAGRRSSQSHQLRHDPGGDRVCRPQGPEVSTKGRDWRHYGRFGCGRALVSHCRIEASGRKGAAAADGERQPAAGPTAEP